jgi:hypothetical protein
VLLFECPDYSDASDSTTAVTVQHKRRVAHEVADWLAPFSEIANLRAGKASIDDVPTLNAVVRAPSGFHNATGTAGRVDDFADEWLYLE